MNFSSQWGEKETKLPNVSIINKLCNLDFPDINEIQALQRSKSNATISGAPNTSFQVQIDFVFAIAHCGTMYLFVSGRHPISRIYISSSKTLSSPRLGAVAVSVLVDCLHVLVNSLDFF